LILADPAKAKSIVAALMLDLYQAGGAELRRRWQHTGVSGAAQH